MRVVLPETFNNKEMFPFLAELVSAENTPLHREIELDFCRLRMIYPTGVTALANVVKLLQQQGCTVTYVRPSDNRCALVNDPVRYLDDSSFFLELFGERLCEESSCRDTTMPLRSIKLVSYILWVKNAVVPWLDRRLSIQTERQIPEFPACMDEVFNNIIDHTQVDVASVHMQHFPKTNEVQIAISDFGVGIPANIRKVPGMENLPDPQCLEQAIKQGVTSKTTPKNRGAGLDTLLQNVVFHNKGRVHIFSKNGHLVAVPSPDAGMFITVEALVKQYPGTLIFIGLKTDTIPPPEDLEEEFSWD